MKNQQILQLKSLTTPLFHDHHYYYQGRPKTQIRGIPHLIGAIIVIPISYYIIFTNRPDHEYLKPPALIFAVGTIICWIVSYLYHTIEHPSLEQEIIIQKIDHHLIFIKITTIWISLYMLTLQHIPTAYILATLSLIISLIINTISIFVFSYTHPMAIHTLTILPFLPLIKPQINTTIFIIFTILLILKYTVFVLEYPITQYIHYHDLFHIINVASIAYFYIGLFLTVQPDYYLDGHAPQDFPDTT